MRRIISFLVCAIMVISLGTSALALKSVKVKSISLSKTSMSLESGQTYALKVGFKPLNTNQKILKYATTNKNVASVNAKGVITAVKPGKATVTVTSSTSTKIFATFTLTVVKSTKWPSKLIMGFLPNEESTDDFKAANKILQKEMSAYVGIPVEIAVCEDYNAAIETMRNDKTHLAAFGPFSYIVAHDRSNAECLVVSAKDGKKENAFYTSVFVTRPDTGIEKLSDVKGKSIAFVDPVSTSGNLVPRGMFSKLFEVKSAEVDKLFSSVQFSGSHNNSLLAVANKTIDFAPMTRITYENGIAKGVIKKEDVKIFAESDPIPQSPIAVRGDLPESLKAKIKQFYLQFNNEEYYKLRGQAGYKFLEVQDAYYDSIRELQKAMGM